MTSITRIALMKHLRNYLLEHYDVVISDYQCREKRIRIFERTQRATKRNFFYFVYGKGREEVAVEALNLGADRYINKNGSPETVYCELADAIKKTVERKKSRKLLTESEQKYRLLVEKSLQGIMIAQYSPLTHCFCQHIHGKNVRLLSRRVNAISSSEIGELIYHEDRAIFFDRFRNRLEGNQAKNSYEFRALRKDGSIVWMEAFATPIEYNGKPAVQAMFLDIDEHKKAQEVLIKSEQRYRELCQFFARDSF